MSDPAPRPWDTKRFLNAREMAELFGFCSAAAFNRARRDLEHEGLPPPMPARAAPRLWRTDQALAFYARCGVAPGDRVTALPLKLTG